MYPQERDSRRRLDCRTVDVPSCTSNDTPYSQPDNDTNILQEGRAKYLCENDGDKRQEAEPYELRRSPSAKDVSAKYPRCLKRVLTVVVWERIWLGIVQKFLTLDDFDSHLNPHPNLGHRMSQ